MYNLIVVWNSGEREEHTFATESEARQMENNLQLTFGNQLWTGITRNVFL